MKSFNRVIIAVVLFISIFALVKLFTKPAQLSEEQMIQTETSEDSMVVEEREATNESVEKSTGNTLPNGVLYIVNGKAVDAIENISPDRIASIDVLKGKSAIDKYGERGKNGVIIITLKR